MIIKNVVHAIEKLKNGIYTDNLKQLVLKNRYKINIEKIKYPVSINFFHRLFEIKNLSL